MPPLINLSKHDIIDRLTTIIKEQEAELEPLRQFAKSMLNPEEWGHAVTVPVRDAARQALGRESVETVKQ